MGRDERLTDKRLARRLSVSQQHIDTLLRLAKDTPQPAEAPSGRNDYAAEVEALLEDFSNGDGAMIELLPGEQRADVVDAVVEVARRKGLHVTWRAAAGHQNRKRILIFTLEG